MYSESLIQNHKIAIDIPNAARIGVPPVLRVKVPDKRDAGYPLGATGGCGEKMKSITILGQNFGVDKKIKLW
jgi:hypothetical protein